MFISITFRATSINKTNKTQQKVKGSKFMFKMSTIHADMHSNEYATVQSLMVSVTVSSLVLRSCTSWNQGLRSTVTITGMQFC